MSVTPPADETPSKSCEQAPPLTRLEKHSSHSSRRARPGIPLLKGPRHEAYTQPKGCIVPALAVNSMNAGYVRHRVSHLARLLTRWKSRGPRTVNERVGVKLWKRRGLIVRLPGMLPSARMKRGGRRGVTSFPTNINFSCKHPRSISDVNSFRHRVVEMNAASTVSTTSGELGWCSCQGG